MLRSMTAYGRAALTTQLGHFYAEIQSVNRKYLEISTALPYGFSRFDSDIKKLLGSTLHRGQINIKIVASFENKAPLMVIPNIPQAKQMKAAWDRIAKELGLSEEKGFTLDLLSGENNLLLYEEDLQDDEQYREIIMEVVKLALQPLTAMKIVEGKNLQADITKRLLYLNNAIEQIAQKSPGATEKYRKKLHDRLCEVLGGCSLETEERILREVAVYAERIDITEEIIRFKSHINQANKLLNSEEYQVGKTFEFLIQELHREINTIGSKSADVEVAHLVVEVKSELERIREQIQNVE